MLWFEYAISQETFFSDLGPQLVLVVMAHREVGSC